MTNKRNTHRGALWYVGIAIMSFLLMAPTVSYSQNFGAGLMLGMTMGSGDSQSFGGSSNVLYAAGEEEFEDVNPLEIKQVSLLLCMDARGNYKDLDRGVNLSLSEIFERAIATESDTQQERVILRVTRVISAKFQKCAYYWFDYVDS